MSDKNKMIHGGDVLIKCLLKENVKYMFETPAATIPDSKNLKIFFD